MNFSLGLKFPLQPTVPDVLAHDGKTVIAGFSLHRRSVPFENYSRNYQAGLRAVSRHTYYDQAKETMTSIRKMFERIAKKGKPLPVLSTSLLAAADEFAHYLGIVDDSPAGSPGQSRLHCFRRESEDPTLEIVFQMLEQHRSDKRGWILYLNKKAEFFKRLRWRGNRLEEFCVRVPALRVYSTSKGGRDSPIGIPSVKFAEPKYVLALILIDLEIGRLIDTLRSVRFHKDGYRFDSNWGNGIIQYIARGRGESSLFENTLFLLFGDHGLVNTKHMMSSTPNPRRHPISLGLDFIEVLNRRLGLGTAEAGIGVSGPVSPEMKLGIDNHHLPVQVAFPYRENSWQDDGVKKLTTEALIWSNAFFDELQETARVELRKKYWWLFFLRRFVFDAKFSRETEKYRSVVVDQLARLYLKAIPRYVTAERRAVCEFFDRNVRLVYGGGARNNADLFLPSTAALGRENGSSESWRKRPSFDQILEYRGGGNRGKGKPTLIEALKNIPGVGLIFVRKNNDEIPTGKILPEEVGFW